MSPSPKNLGARCHQPSQTELGTVFMESALVCRFIEDSVRTVFFFARSPDAPRTTIMVLSLSSMVLPLRRKISESPRKVTSFQR